MINHIPDKPFIISHLEIFLNFQMRSFKETEREKEKERERVICSKALNLKFMYIYISLFNIFT